MLQDVSLLGHIGKDVEYRLCVTDKVYSATVVTYPDVSEGILQKIADISGWNAILTVICRYVVELHTLRISESDAM